MVGYNTKLANNLESWSDESEQTSEKITAQDRGLDTSDEVMTKNIPEHSRKPFKIKQIPSHHLISFQKRDEIKETLLNP